MPTVLTHAVSGLALGYALAPRTPPPRYYFACAILPILPDADVIGFGAGIPYWHLLGHRGISHSLFAAGLLGTAAAVGLTLRSSGETGQLWRLAFILSVVTASHGLLDGCTDGGYGIAFFAPFDSTRYFFPFRPVHVSPIGLRHFTSEAGAQVLASEFVWIWLPSLLVAAAIVCWRRARAG